MHKTKPVEQSACFSKVLIEVLTDASACVALCNHGNIVQF